MKKVVTKKCLVCDSSYNRKDESNKDWNGRKYCSLKCYRKVPRSPEVRFKIRETCKKNCPGWKVGRKRPIDLRVRQSQKMKERVAKGIHNFWKGGISQQTRKWRSNFQNSIEYRLWRTAVFERDNYTCLWCGARNGNGKKVVLNADHIQGFAEHPELRLAIDNGRTLCRPCHYIRHSNKSK